MASPTRAGYSGGDTNLSILLSREPKSKLKYNYYIEPYHSKWLKFKYLTVENLNIGEFCRSSWIDLIITVITKQVGYFQGKIESIFDFRYLWSFWWRFEFSVKVFLTKGAQELLGLNPNRHQNSIITENQNWKQFFP